MTTLTQPLAAVPSEITAAADTTPPVARVVDPATRADCAWYVVPGPHAPAPGTHAHAA